MDMSQDKGMYKVNDNYVKVNGALYPIKKVYIVGEKKKPWIEDYTGNINERMNIGYKSWYGGNSVYAAARKPSGAKIRFKAKLAYTELQRYDKLMLDIDGIVDEKGSSRHQECIRFWAHSSVWSTEGGNTQLEAPYMDCGPTFTYRDRYGRLDKRMGSSIQMYDMSPMGYKWEVDINGWGTGAYTESGWQWFPEADDWSIQHTHQPKKLLDIDIIFDVRPASYYIDPFLDTPSDLTSYYESLREGLITGEYVPCVVYGMDFDIARGGTYTSYGDGWVWKSKDTVVWLYDLETFIDGVPSDEYSDGGLFFRDGELSYKPDGTAYNDLFGVHNNSYGIRIIGNQYKTSPWERYPSL